jgi:TP901-1 family phage major tail protein
VFSSAATDAMLREMFFAGICPRLEVTIPDFGRITGPFHIAGLEYAGDHDGEATFEVRLESSGALSFAAS